MRLVWSSYGVTVRVTGPARGKASAIAWVQPCPRGELPGANRLTAPCNLGSWHLNLMHY